MMSARRGLGALLVTVTAAASLAGACGQQVILGGDPVCEKQPCGTPCTVDPCAGGPSGPGGSSGPSGSMGSGSACTQPPAAGVCDGDGACAITLPKCALRLPCAGRDGGPPPACGDTCDSLQPGAAPGTFACDRNGACQPRPVVCTPPDPCATLDCGEPCGLMPPMVCDNHHACVPALMALCPGPPPYDPCHGAKCGDPCKSCNPANPTCTEQPPHGCDPQGHCVPMPVCM